MTAPDSSNHTRDAASRVQLAAVRLRQFTASPAFRHVWLPVAALTLLALILYFYKLGDFRTLGSHEGYATIPAREMIESGDWIVPRFGGIPRLHKPPLNYWILAATSKVFGGFSEWVVRLPAALSSAALAIIVGVWAARWYGLRPGLAAALIQLTSLYVINYGRKAEVDMVLCLLTTGAMFLIAREVTRPDAHELSGRRPASAWTAIYALLALAWLAKFHYGPAMVVGPMVIYWIIDRNRTQWRALVNIPGILLGVGAVVIWPLLLVQQVPNVWQVWKEETMDRALGGLGSEPVWYYAVHIVGMTLPWTPFAILAIRKSWREAWKQGDRRERFLWVWMLTSLVILNLSADKHKHYLFAMLPAVALLASRPLSEFWRNFGKDRVKIPALRLVVVSACFVCFAGATTFMLAERWPSLAREAKYIGVLIAAGGLTACVFLWKQQSKRAVFSGVSFALIGYMIVMGSILPGRDSRLSAANFARKVRSAYGEEQQIYVYHMGMQPIVYYAGTPVTRLETREDVAATLAARDEMLIIADETRVEPLEEIGELQILRRMSRLNEIESLFGSLILIRLTPLSPIEDDPGSYKKPFERFANSDANTDQTLIR